MKLKRKVANKAEVKTAVTEVNTKKVSDENSKRGKRAKRKGGQYEREIANKFQQTYGVELKRTPQSGGFAKKSEKADDYRGDITIVDTKQMLLLHIECKAHKTLSLKQWLHQAESDCPKGRIPVVVFHRHGTSKDYIALKLNDWYSLISPQFFNEDTSKVHYKKWNVFSWFDEISSLYRPLLLLGGDENDYVVGNLDDFLNAVPKNKVIGKRCFD